VKYYTLTTQVLTKIVFYNLLPKSGEHSYARGSTPLLIYYLLKDIRVDISKLIIDFMLSEHLLIPNRHLLFGILIIRLLKLLKFDLFAKQSIKPSVDINITLLKRMHAPTPQPPTIILVVAPGSFSASLASVDPYTVLLTFEKDRTLAFIFSWSE